MRTSLKQTTKNLFSMKNIYFLRHGQTALNKGWVHQSPDTPLSEVGHIQAIRVAKHFATIDLDTIIASPFTRTQETAQAISKTKGLQIETNELFTELRKPTVLRGKSWFSIRSTWIMGLLYLFAGRPDWHHSDEENLGEFHTRTRTALEYLSQRPEQNILVVTHRGLMSALLESMKRDGMDTLHQYRRALWKNLSIHNGCYIHATWVPEGDNGETLTGTWSIETKITCP